MGAAWVTTGSPRPGPVINSLTAACEEGYVPDTIHVVSNPSVASETDDIVGIAEGILQVYDVDDPTVDRTELKSETDFTGLVDYFDDAISRARTQGDDVAVDVTPGRKFMSAIAFQAGIQFDADHIFYL